MTVIAPHPFDAAVQLSAQEDGIFTGRTSQDYNNMVGPFGGITAATLLQSVLQHPQRLGDPLSITVNYAAPIADGEFSISAEPVRTSRTTQHWVLRMSQNDVVTTTATAVFGTRRETWAATEVEPPRVPPAAAIEPQVSPEFIRWMQNYEMRFATGGLGDMETAAPDSTSTLWVRDLPERPLDHLSLTAISDVFIPRVMMRLGRMVPAGTVSLSVYFHTDQAALSSRADAPVLGTARSQHFGTGFFDQTAQLWAEDGALLATSHQLVYFKD